MLYQTASDYLPASLHAFLEQQIHSNCIADLITLSIVALETVVCQSLASQQQSETEDRLKQQATLVADLTKKELGLQQQVSELSQELCQVRDRLALLSQRERELQGNIEDSRNTKDELNERLTNKENEATILREAMSAIQLELSVAQERHAQQQEDIMKLSGKHKE